ncbi:MAG: hypothetical protein U1B80_00470, partial [Anaerolineaceae bacterium]|nr:hypothetical protein [Anaerolineaceae bacterium]
MSNKNRNISWVLCLVCLVSLTACGSPAPIEPTLDPNAIYTQAAQTVAAQLTQTALVAPTATSTPEPTPTVPEPTPTFPPIPTLELPSSALTPVATVPAVP